MGSQRRWLIRGESQDRSWPWAAGLPLALPIPSQCFQLKGALPAPQRGEQSVGLSSACQGPEPRALSSSEGGHVRARQELWKRNVA